MIPQNKAEWRKNLAARKATLSDEEQRTKSGDLTRHFIASEIYLKATNIALFIAVQPEPNLSQLINASKASQKKLFLPRYDSEKKSYHFSEWKNHDTLVSGPYNIPQPQSSSTQECHLDVILVPGLAFDHAGNRLGHGAGIYDRLLVNQVATRIGVAFDYQRVPTLPAEPHDCPMSYLLTEKGLISI